MNTVRNKLSKNPTIHNSIQKSVNKNKLSNVNLLRLVSI